MHTFVLAGGCFWCLDAVYRTLKGVSDVVSGYTGGQVPEPSYELVCTGSTGHAEAVAVTFDPEVIPDQVILDVFFTLHDPRQLNRQGNDIGTQYRSGIYYTSDDQKRVAEASREAYEPVLRENGYGEITTEIVAAPEFWFAEDYHQQYLAKNPNGYRCHSATGVRFPSDA
jgi:peptide-methionine (S)-S-oxide reductase